MSKYPELDTYITQARAAGMSDEAIRQALATAGWGLFDIAAALPVTKEPSTHPQHKTHPLYALSRVQPLALVTTALLFIVIGLSGALAYAWKDRIDLTKTNTAAVKEFLRDLSNGSVGFTDAGELVFPDEQKFKEKRDVFISEKRDFIEVDLTDMKLHLYRQGVRTEEFPIMGKGKEGSWWETPTGSYKTLTKSENHFSSIGEVWMPWSIQFYGNFFIHGWPSYENGTPVPVGYSGGCIRLSTDDAEKVYTFADIGTPILIREREHGGTFGNLTGTSAPVPTVTAHSFNITNLSNGETLLSKRGDAVKEIGALGHLLAGVVASELIYLERSTKVSEENLAALLTAFAPRVGDRYIAFDLLYPLLMQTSHEARSILSNFIGSKEFQRAQNEKAASLELNDTYTSDISNTSTAYDLSALLRYVYFKRKFLLDISLGTPYHTAGGTHAATIEHTNNFLDDNRLVGMIHTSEKLSGALSVWELETTEGIVPISIVILDSTNLTTDIQTLLSWVAKKGSRT